MNLTLLLFLILLKAKNLEKAKKAIPVKKDHKVNVANVAIKVIVENKVKEATAVYLVKLDQKVILDLLGLLVFLAQLERMVQKEIVVIKVHLVHWVPRECVEKLDYKDLLVPPDLLELQPLMAK